MIVNVQLVRSSIWRKVFDSCKKQ